MLIFPDASTKEDLTPKHVALELHKKAKAEWENSGTCDWLMQIESFLEWERIGAKYAFLWLHGRCESLTSRLEQLTFTKRRTVGCGKTILM